MILKYNTENKRKPQANFTLEYRCKNNVQTETQQYIKMSESNPW